jgi:hypothetical protein
MKHVLIFLPLLAVILLSSCSKQDREVIPVDDNEVSDGATLNSRGNEKINICHQSNKTWKLMTINLNVWAQHQSHGDVRLDDQDKDGYVPFNECGFGNMGDCNDLNKNVNPGKTELCSNGIDDDCDGLIDGSDSDCNCWNIDFLNAQPSFDYYYDSDVNNCRNEGYQIVEIGFYNSSILGVYYVVDQGPGNKIIFSSLYNTGTGEEYVCEQFESNGDIDENDYLAGLVSLRTAIINHPGTTNYCDVNLKSKTNGLTKLNLPAKVIQHLPETMINVLKSR